MKTVARKLPLSAEQAVLSAWARERGWSVRWEHATRTRSEFLHLARGGRSLVAVFSHDGAFEYAKAPGDGAGGVELNLPALARELARPAVPADEVGRRASDAARTDGDRPASATGATPEETPPAEGSTTAGISVPEPPELRRAWGAWPLVIVGLLVLCVVVFMVARIAA
ncbi:DUF6480 family protein [Kitasatospora camelliae]|uniref:DUF6480 family protein n=1 Tax=Kitasatospora camelliae TaxID=3156397 RepID=A0AAU8JQY0_9ACTN